MLPDNLGALMAEEVTKVPEAVEKALVPEPEIMIAEICHVVLVMAEEAATVEVDIPEEAMAVEDTAPAVAAECA